MANKVKEEKVVEEKVDKFAGGTNRIDHGKCPKCGWDIAHDGKCKNQNCDYVKNGSGK